MFAGPRKVGKRLYLIGALLGLAATVSAVEPVCIGTIKFLRDGKVDKICFDYEGTLRYRESQFPRARYGYLDFEPAICKESKTLLKPRGTLIKEIKIISQNEASRQRVRLLYDLERWVAPTIRDTGNRLEIWFVPVAAASPAADSAGSAAEPGASNESVAGASPSTPFPAAFGSLKDDLFADYLKLDTQKPLGSTDSWPLGSSSVRAKADAVATPISLPPFAPESLNAKPGARRAEGETVAAIPPVREGTSSRREPVLTSPAQGGEGSSPATDSSKTTEPAKATEAPKPSAAATPTIESVKPIEPIVPIEPPKTAATATSLASIKYEVIKSKAYLPEAMAAGEAKITGSRGFEFVDLGQPIFQKPVSLTFKDADLQNAIRILARYADLNIVLDPNTVKGRVTIELNNVAVGPALASILRTSQLELVREAGGIYRIVPSAQVRRTPQREEVTVHIPLNWVTADDVKKMLDPIILGGQIGVDSVGNSLIITDSPLKIEEIANVITRIDRPEKQVMLETRLVEMNTDLSRGLGISWDLARLDRDISKEALGLPAQTILGTRPSLPVVLGYDPVSGQPITYTPPGTPIFGNTPTAGSITNPFSADLRNLAGVGGGTAQGMDSLRIIEPLANELRGAKWAWGKEVSIFGTAFQLSTLLEAAESANLAKTLAAPRVVTVNNQPAKINILRKIPYRSTIVGAGGVQSETFAYEDVGIQLTVTPNITNNDYVRMRIEPTQKILIGQVGLARPTVDERVSVTNVIVKDEETAVIAGLRQQSFTESGLGVPWLSQIPVLGWAFKSKTYGNRKTDLMAFVTPHLIKEVQTLSENEKQRYNEIDVQWDLPDYFFDDVKYDLKK